VLFFTKKDFKRKNNCNFFVIIPIFLLHLGQNYLKDLMYET